MISRALYFDGPRRVAVRDISLAAPTAGEVLVRGLASAVSQGTELLLYRGEGPEPFDASVAGAASSYPLRYGYSWVGVVVERGVGPLPEEGTRVFALAPHGAAHILGAGDVRPIRTDIPAHRASLGANLETAVTCAWDAEASLGERVVVLGAGLVGILITWTMARVGAKVTLIDPRPSRRTCASKLVPWASIVDRATPDGRYDVVIDATGDPRAIDEAVAWAAPSGRIVVASFYGKRRAAIDLGDRFHRQRLSLISSQVSSIPPRMSMRWSVERRFSVVEDLLGEPNLDALLAAPVPFERAPELYAKLDTDEDPMPCHVFDYAS